MGERAELDRQLGAELARLAERGLARALAPAAPGAIDFTSNDYLGLARDPAVIASARAALEECGAGGRASRLLGGGSSWDARTELAVAEWLGADTATLFPSGYHANLGVIGALAGPGDVILSDELNHASLIDAARLSRARVLTYAHADPRDLARGLALATRAHARTLVVSESVFSMDGDLAPLAELCLAAARHGAWLVIDEAHACGLIGPEGAGGWARLGPDHARSPTLAARVVTGGKALGVAGAWVVGSEALRRTLIHKSRSLLFTTAVTPATSGALLAAVGLARGAHPAREHALSLARSLAERLRAPTPDSAIVSHVVGDSLAAVELAQRAQAQGFDVRAVRPPTVPPGTARLRLVCHAFNTQAQVEALAACLGEASGGASAAIARTPRAAVLVIAGTDTGVGKTVVSALVVRALRRRGPARYWKPVQTGTESDTLAVLRLAQMDADQSVPCAFHFALPASPHESAAAEGRRVDPARIEVELESALTAPDRGRLVVELAGGLCVPWTEDLLQVDWLAAHRLAPVLVARSGVGTLNHTLLSLEALRSRSLEPRALFLVGEPHPSNRATLARLAGVELIFELPHLEPLDTAALDRWLSANDLDRLFLDA